MSDHAPSFIFPHGTALYAVPGGYVGVEWTILFRGEALSGETYRLRIDSKTLEVVVAGFAMLALKFPAESPSMLAGRLALVLADSAS